MTAYKSDEMMWYKDNTLILQDSTNCNNINI